MVGTSGQAAAGEPNDLVVTEDVPDQNAVRVGSTTSVARREDRRGQTNAFLRRKTAGLLKTCQSLPKHGSMDMELEPRIPASPGVAAQNQSRRRSSLLLSTAILEEVATIDFDMMAEPTPERRRSFAANTASQLDQQLSSSYELGTNPPDMPSAPPYAKQSRPSTLEVPDEFRRQAAAVKVQAVYRGKEGRELAAVRAHVRAGEGYDAAVVTQAPVVKPPPPPRTPSPARALASSADRELSEEEEEEEEEWDQLFGIWYLPRKRNTHKTPAKVGPSLTPKSSAPTRRKGTWKIGNRSRHNACGAVAECWSASVRAVQHLTTRLTGLGLLGLLLLLLVSTLDAMVRAFLAPDAALPTATLVLDEGSRSRSASQSMWILG